MRNRLLIIALVCIVVLPIVVRVGLAICPATRGGLVGRYTYDHAGHKDFGCSDVLELKADGTYVQTYSFRGNRTVGCGTWTYSFASLTMRGSCYMPTHHTAGPWKTTDRSAQLEPNCIWQTVVRRSLLGGISLDLYSSDVDVYRKQR